MFRCPAVDLDALEAGGLEDWQPMIGRQPGLALELNQEFAPFGQLCAISRT